MIYIELVFFILICSRWYFRLSSSDDSQPTKFRTQNAILKIKNYLMMTLIHVLFDKSPSVNVNSNYDIMSNKIHRVAETNNSSKTYKFNKSKTKTYRSNPQYHKVD